VSEVTVLSLMAMSLTKKFNCSLYLMFLYLYAHLLS